ncbi:MAG: serine hydrolase [Sulfolobales archaeon]
MIEFGDLEELGFSRERVERALGFICSYSENKLIPGIEILVIRRGYAAIHKTCGWAQTIPRRRLLTPGMLFDLASLTKVLAGSIVAGILVSEGLIHLKQRVSEILPEFSRTAAGVNEIKDRVRIWMLLTHSSGLPPWLPLYRISRSREEIFSEVLRVFPSYSPGENAIYSDLGFILLTKISEEVSGERFDRLFEKTVAGRLGLKNTLYNPLTRGFSTENIVSTEVVESGEALTGVVHDENARAMDGVSAHAGLFSTAFETGLISLELLRSYKGESDLLIPPAYARTMFSRWICGDRCYGLGWWIYDKISIESGGDLLGEGFGHTGFTGTSIWISPIYDLIVVLMTNRVHPSRDNRHIDRLRTIAHNMILSSLKRL